MTNNEVFQQLDFVANLVPTPFYWLDHDSKAVGANEMGLKAIGAPNIEYIIGKKLHQIYKDKDIATTLQEDVDNILKTGISSNTEDKIIDITTGKVRYYSAVRAPIRSSDGKIIGVIGASIEITAEKELEQLRLKNERDVAAQSATKECREFMDSLARDINSFIASDMNKRMGGFNRIYSVDNMIKLTPHQVDILYFLSIGLSPKEIANCLAITRGRNLTPATVTSIIDKTLYVKFGVNSVSQLLAKARIMKMIPVIPDEQFYEKQNSQED